MVQEAELIIINIDQETIQWGLEYEQTIHKI